MYPHDFLHLWGWVGVLIIWAIWAVLVFGLGWRLGNQMPRYKHPSHLESTPHPESTPLEILQRRYARGEITREQFQQMKQDLGD